MYTAARDNLNIFLNFFAIFFVSLLPINALASDLESKYREKLYDSIYQKFEVVLYNSLRHDGLDHTEALKKIRYAANVGVQCQFEALNKLPNTLVKQIFTLVNEGKSIMEANHIAMTNFKIGYISSGKSVDDFLKFIEPSAVAWDYCMKENLK